MATPTIPNGEEYFFPIIYEGNGAGQRVGKFVPFTDNGTIDNSCLFENNVNSYLQRTLSSNGSGTTLTFSCWVKRDILTQGLIGSLIMMHSDVSANGEVLTFDASDRLYYYEVTSGSRKWEYISNRTFKDTSKWYHIYVRRDTTDSTAADRIQIYVDGERITSWNTETKPALNATGYWNQTTLAATVGNTFSPSYTDGAGYLAEVNMVDGSNPAVSTFGLTDTSTGRWIPKTLSGITYGTNGFRLKFQDSSALGDDTSGNGNDFTATNLTSANQTTDSPTQNHATFDPNDDTGTMPLSEGNREVTQSGSSSGAIRGTLAPSSGKYYFEFKAISVAASDGFGGVGIQLKNEPVDAATSVATIGANTYIYRDDGFMIHNGVGTSGFTNYGSGAIIGVALDLDNGKLYFSYSSGAGTDGVYENSGDPVAGTGAVYTLPSNQRYAPYLVFKGSSGQNYSLNTGQTSFNTTPPTDFVALQQDNLPETAKGVSGLVWTKNRDSTDNHQLYDSSRGKQLLLTSNTTSAEATVTDGLQKFLAGGQQIEDDVSINTSGESYVSWNWVANGGSTSSNNDGSITSTVQANTTAGFSIVQYTGTGSAGTIGHGLSSAPEWVIAKSRSNNTGDTFSVYHVGMTSASYYLRLGGTNAETNASVVWNGTAPTSSVFSVGTASGTNTNTYTYLAYCWHSVDGFSKFGKYTGTGNADGPFIYTGFKPAFLMLKSSSNAVSWYMFDNKRNPINPAGKRIVADGTFVEDAGTTEAFDFLSNGFKLRNASTGTNGSGYTMVYMAFAEHPFVGDGVSPVTAR